MADDSSQEKSEAPTGKKRSDARKDGTVAKSTEVDNTAMWYARGIGVVKTLSYDEKGKLKASSELHEPAR